MEKKRSWLERLKRFFIAEPKPKPEKKEKRKTWLPRSLKTQNSFALPAPSQPATNLLRQAEEEPNTADVADIVKVELVPSSHPPSEELAAIRIQAAYRGYLARRALRALKGLVMLQALIRGQSVRRRTAITLRGLECLMRIQSHSRGRVKGFDQVLDSKDFTPRRTREPWSVKPTAQLNKDWDSSPLSKEEMNAISTSREEALIKRIRALQYASLHNEKMNTRRQLMTREELDTHNHRSSWLEEWVDSQPFDKDMPLTSHPSPFRDFDSSDPSIQSRSSFACLDSSYEDEAGDDSLNYLARRSFVRPRSRQTSLHDDNSVSCSPAFPSYMASTASTKAKFRSMSTPKERLGALDIYSEHCFPHNDRLFSPIASIASEVSFAKAGKPPLHNQRSPRLKATTPVNSRRSPTHHSFDTECAFQNVE